MREAMRRDREPRARRNSAQSKWRIFRSCRCASLFAFIRPLICRCSNGGGQDAGTTIEITSAENPVTIHGEGFVNAIRGTATFHAAPFEFPDLAMKKFAN